MGRSACSCWRKPPVPTGRSGSESTTCSPERPVTCEDPSGSLRRVRNLSPERSADPASGVPLFHEVGSAAYFPADAADSGDPDVPEEGSAVSRPAGDLLSDSGSGADRHPRSAHTRRYNPVRTVRRDAPFHARRAVPAVCGRAGMLLPAGSVPAGSDRRAGARCNADLRGPVQFQQSVQHASAVSGRTAEKLSDNLHGRRHHSGGRSAVLLLLGQPLHGRGGGEKEKNSGSADGVASALHSADSAFRVLHGEILLCQCAGVPESGALFSAGRNEEASAEKRDDAAVQRGRSAGNPAGGAAAGSGPDSDPRPRRCAARISAGRSVYVLPGWTVGRGTGQEFPGGDPPHDAAVGQLVSGAGFPRCADLGAG